MKLFSASWKSSRKASKQRKFRINSPLHIKRSLLAAPLAEDLARKYGTGAVSLREGDSIKVARGEFRGLVGKVSAVSLKKGNVSVDGAERIRKDGTKSFFPLKPSNLLVTELNIEDKRRIASLTRKQEQGQERRRG
ncbi:50S ribosomal protein L24 [Candidatus Woesearchaeota archaeon]|nr:50S ribosomal protein L24 [Candidatus Woesearchaeota archaeon]